MSTTPSLDDVERVAKAMWAFQSDIPWDQAATATRMHWISLADVATKALVAEADEVAK